MEIMNEKRITSDLQYLIKGKYKTIKSIMKDMEKI